jgi:hypothetical protein
MLRQADPLLRTVGKRLVLPDRHLGLQIVNEAASGGKCLVAMGGGGSHHDGEVADLQRPRAVVGSEPHTPVGVSHLSPHSLQLVQGTRMRGVVKGLHGLLGPCDPVVVADRTDEDDDASGPRVRNGGKSGVDRERGVRNGHSWLHGVEPTWQRLRYAGSDLGTRQLAAAVTVTW